MRVKGKYYFAIKNNHFPYTPYCFIRSRVLENYTGIVLKTKSSIDFLLSFSGPVIIEYLFCNIIFTFHKDDTLRVWTLRRIESVSSFNYLFFVRFVIRFKLVLPHSPSSRVYTVDITTWRSRAYMCNKIGEINANLFATCTWQIPSVAISKCTLVADTL